MSKLLVVVLFAFLCCVVLVQSQYTCDSETGFAISCKVTNADSNNAIIYDSSLSQRGAGSATGHLANLLVPSPIGYLETYDYGIYNTGPGYLFYITLFNKLGSANQRWQFFVGGPTGNKAFTTIIQCGIVGGGGNCNPVAQPTFPVTSFTDDAGAFTCTVMNSVTVTK
eukprot:TRINITY_DN636_c0_g1_i1.p1 TRINITY_DN636_c0_g1~~TRINITY_DN636_c0_g1_i1.p1  ORF type:complete len:168 (+),score=25.46 TRINITY_DN636_c0_g1_i1:54-557(+)